MTALRRLLPGAAFLAAGFLASGLSAQVRKTLPPAGFPAVGPAPATPAAPGKTPSRKKPAAKAKSKTRGPVSPTPKPPKKINPRHIRVHLMDGSVIAGELAVDKIEVETEFGTLTIPVEKVLSITPGLSSHTKLAARIKRLIEDLGGKNYKAREAAHQELLKLGPPVRDILAKYRNDKDAERKRHINEIVEKLDEISGADEIGFDDEGSSKTKAWVLHDVVVTPTFTVAGKVKPSQFQVRSKYGALQVSLNDIQRTVRDHVTKEAVLKRLSVAGSNLMQRTLKSSGIRVQPGDRVTIAASGLITMPPWGSNARSGPDGVPNYGSQSIDGVQFGYGALGVRVGDSGKWMRVGSRSTFTARKSGVLKFGIAMHPSYSQGNYFFGGEYKLRIKVDPKQ